MTRIYPVPRHQCGSLALFHQHDNVTDDLSAAIGYMLLISKANRLPIGRTDIQGNFLFDFLSVDFKRLAVRAKRLFKVKCFWRGANLI